MDDKTDCRFIVFNSKTRIGDISGLYYKCRLLIDLLTDFGGGYG